MMAQGDVNITAGYVKKLGQRFIDWGQDIDKAYVDLAAANITPGSLPNAAVLKKEFGDRLQTWKDNFKALRLMFNDTGNQLITLAEGYQGTEDLNKADAEKVRDVIGSIGKYYPDANKVLSPEIGDGYFPQPNPPPSSSNK
jgi:hypothetical protein